MKAFIKTGFALAFIAGAIAARADSTIGPIQWSADNGGDGNYYQIVGLDDAQWLDAYIAAQQQTLTVDGTVYYGELAPVTSAAQAQFLQDNLVEPSAGDYTITWTGDFVQSGTIFAGTPPMDDTSWFNWSGSSSASVSDSYDNFDAYGIALTGYGYGAGNDLSLRAPDDTLGSYLVAFEVAPAPEPSTLALASVGGIACLFLRGRLKK